MKVCPVCQATNIHASHRQGWLERGPLTWVSVLPFRCASCQTRYYRFAFSDARRRHHGLMVSLADRERPPRWPLVTGVRVTIQQAEKTILSVNGETENASARGVRLRLPTEVPVGSRVNLILQGASAPGGIVRWHMQDKSLRHVHGVELDRPLERHAKASRPLARLRRRRFVRRILLGCVAFGLIALVTAGVVWLMEAMRAYNPQYYEPKDIERERYEIQRRP